MEKIIKSKMTSDEIIELDDILNRYYISIKEDLIEKQQYTTSMIEKISIEYLNHLFNSITSFKITKRHNNKEKDVQANDISNGEIKNSKIKQFYELLKEYYIFVVRILKKYGDITINNANRLAKDWLIDFLKIEAYKISLENL